jgi:hypothetical protein
MAKNIDEFFYFDGKIRNFIPKDLIEKLLEKKYPDNVVIFTLIHSILQAYQKLTISPLFESLPKLKVIDYSNLSPFIRIFITKEARKNKDLINYLNFSSEKSEFFINSISPSFTTLNVFSLFIILSTILKISSLYFNRTIIQEESGLNIMNLLRAFSG